MTPKQPLGGLLHQLLESQDGNTLIQEGLLHHGSWDTWVSANHLTLCPQTGALGAGKRIWASLTSAKLWWLRLNIFSPVGPVGGSQTSVAIVGQEWNLWDELRQWWNITGWPWCSSWTRMLLYWFDMSLMHFYFHGLVVHFLKTTQQLDHMFMFFNDPAPSKSPQYPPSLSSTFPFGSRLHASIDRFSWSQVKAADYLVGEKARLVPSLWATSYDLTCVWIFIVINPCK